MVARSSYPHNGIFNTDECGEMVLYIDSAPMVPRHTVVNHQYISSLKTPNILQITATSQDTHGSQKQQKLSNGLKAIYYIYIPTIIFFHVGAYLDSFKHLGNKSTKTKAKVCYIYG